MADDGEPPPQPTWEGPVDAEGRPHGQGTMSYPPPPPGEDEEERPGDKFTGAMVHGQRQGRGTYAWSSGAAYEGGYEANAKSGKGTMKFPDKSQYQGDWVADRMQGQGVYTYSNGDQYEGGFEAGKKHGRGTYVVKAHGCQYQGVWEAGQFVQGTWVHQDSTQFQGDFSDDAPATGIYYFAGSGLAQAGEYSRQRGWRGGDVLSAAPPASAC